MPNKKKKRKEKLYKQQAKSKGESNQQQQQHHGNRDKDQQQSSIDENDSVPCLTDDNTLQLTECDAIPDDNKSAIDPNLLPDVGDHATFDQAIGQYDEGACGGEDVAVDIDAWKEERDFRDSIAEEGAAVCLDVQKTGKKEKAEIKELSSSLQHSLQKHKSKMGVNIEKCQTVQIGQTNVCTVATDSPSSSDSSDTVGEDTRREKDWPKLPTSTPSKANRNKESSVWKEINITVNTAATQIGDGVNIANVNRRSSGSISDRDGQSSGPASAEISPKTTVYSDTAIFNINPQAPRETAQKHGQVKKFREIVDGFSRGHYMLIVNEPEHVTNIGVLGLIKWLAVLDLNPRSWQTGLLSRIGKSLSNKLLLNRFDWQDTKCQISDKSLAWISMFGSTDKPESVIDVDYNCWRQKIKKSFEEQTDQIKKFTDQYTHLTVVVIWPSEQDKIKHLYYLLSEIICNLSPKVVIAVEEKANMLNEEKSILTLLENENDTNVVSLDVRDVCSVIQGECHSVSTGSEGLRQLPTSDTKNDPCISEREAFWLEEDMDVLYIDDMTGIMYTRESLEDETQSFFRGGTLPWSWWYQAGPGVVDVERDINRQIINFIKTRHIQQCKSGIITLFHNPGSGGTTAAQRVVWELRREVPCVQIKHGSRSTDSDITEKIKILHERTQMPILILIDSEEQRRVDAIFRSLRGFVCVIVLYVQRYWQRIERDYENNGWFWLKSTVSKKECLLLEHQYLNRCTTTDQKCNVQTLARNVVQGGRLTLFELGLAARGDEYKGITKYVEGYLRLKENTLTSELMPWQKALQYLSLVYFFGQSYLPCHFFSSLLGGEKNILTIDDIPYEMEELVVKDVNERRRHTIRISHYLVAKEILDQTLSFPNKSNSNDSENLSQAAKKKLADLSVEFIGLAGQKCNEPSSYMSHIMTKTFICRYNKATGENETQASKRKKPRVSPILEQASSEAPFTDRFRIYEQLTKSFPRDAEFKAHLGRLYTICRPEKEKEAEKHLKNALDLSLSEAGKYNTDDIPHNSKVELMHIYHMYGNMLLSKVGKFTGKFLGDQPKVCTQDQDFDDTFEHELLPNVKKACDMFTQSRNHTPLGCEESMGYICEIQVRLMLCSFVHEHCHFKDLGKYLEESSSEAAEFIQDCCVAIDEIFLELFSVVEPESMDDNVDSCQQWYFALFKKVPGHYILRQKDTIKTRRLEIAKIKLQYGGSKVHCVLENIDKKDDIHRIVTVYESNFKEYQSQYAPDIPKRSIELDYREWMYAIRHRLFKESYRIEDVLMNAESWFEMLKSPHSRFYMFVLKSLLGFGTDGNDGNVQLLIEAQKLKEEVLKFSRFVTKPRYPREWLGLPHHTDIRRLEPGLRFFGQIENRQMNSEKLEIRKGTICPPNDKPSVGFISLDLGPRNTIPVKVFFIPARTEDLKGSVNKNTRVEFVIGLSLLHGYDAFNVKRLMKINCSGCTIEVERRSCDRRVTCPRCKSEIKIPKDVRRVNYGLRH